MSIERKSDQTGDSNDKLHQFALVDMERQIKNLTVAEVVCLLVPSFLTVWNGILVGLPRIKEEGASGLALFNTLWPKMTEVLSAPVEKFGERDLFFAYLAWFVITGFLTTSGLELSKLATKATNGWHNDEFQAFEGMTKIHDAQSIVTRLEEFVTNAREVNSQGWTKLIKKDFSQILTPASMTHKWVREIDTATKWNQDWNDIPNALTENLAKSLQSIITVQATQDERVVGLAPSAVIQNVAHYLLSHLDSDCSVLIGDIALEASLASMSHLDYQTPIDDKVELFIEGLTCKERFSRSLIQGFLSKIDAVIKNKELENQELRNQVNNLQQEKVRKISTVVANSETEKQQQINDIESQYHFKINLLQVQITYNTEAIEQSHQTQERVTLLREKALESSEVKNMNEIYELYEIQSSIKTYINTYF